MPQRPTTQVAGVVLAASMAASSPCAALAGTSFVEPIGRTAPTTIVGAPPRSIVASGAGCAATGAHNDSFASSFEHAGPAVAGAAVSAVFLARWASRRPLRRVSRRGTPSVRWSAPRGSAINFCSAGVDGTATAFAAPGVASAGRQKTGKVARAAAAAATVDTDNMRNMEDRPSDGEIRKIFKEATAGSDMMTFEDAINIEVIGDLLDEEAVTEEELEAAWGDPEEMLGFKAFVGWYNEVLDMYDEFLDTSSEKPPAALLDEIGGPTEEEADGAKRKVYTDDELLEDVSAVGQSIQSVLEDTSVFGGNDEEEEEAADQKALEAGKGRNNEEITRLFREQCNDSNLLDFDGLLMISEVEEMLRDGDIAESELDQFWTGLPKTKNCIDVLAFRTLLSKIDELFEEEEEEEEETTMVKRAKSGPREPKVVKEELYTTINGLLVDEGGKNCGIGGVVETDPPIRKLCAELEANFKQQVEDIDEFDPSLMCGDWELIYTTSAKMRRWGSVLNSGQNVKDGKLITLVESFGMDEKDLSPTYDMEELFDADGQELGMRGVGSWLVSSTANVVTGDDDLRVKLQINAVEHDLPDGEVVNTNLKCLLGVSCRTYCYCFICYIDDELRVMRTSLTGDLLFIYKKLPEEDKARVEQITA